MIDSSRDSNERAIPMNSQTPQAARHQITRLRQESRKRKLTVSRIERITPGMQRIELFSAELADFNSSGSDDHIKLFIPPLGRSEAVMRDYTPRAYTSTGGFLTIDFSLHATGPATAWAISARVGMTLEIAGPRSSSVVPDDFDWYLLIGDDTALSAIGRRVEELRPRVPVITVIQIGSEAERQCFVTQSKLTQHWVTRSTGIENSNSALHEALVGIDLPRGDGYVWIAGEREIARGLRKYMIDVRGHPKAWLKAAAYWTLGSVASHAIIED
jgi:NADPH-dependent ferric siderophore reductase